MTHALRWLAVLPATIAAWYAVAFVGLYTHSLAEKTLCPAGDWMSGFCHNDNVQATLQFLMHFHVGLSAFAVCLAAAAVAPSHKINTALAALTIGSTVALYFSWHTQAWSLLAVALASGIAGTGIVILRQRRNTQARILPDA